MLTTALSPSHRWSGPKGGNTYNMRCVETSKFPKHIHRVVPVHIWLQLLISLSRERERREQSKQVTFLAIKDREVSDDRDKLRKRPLMKKRIFRRSQGHFCKKMGTPHISSLPFTNNKC